MSSRSAPHSELLPDPRSTGRALPLWTYANEELLELEYQEFFLKSWQMAGHVCDLPNAGDYITFDLWRDSVVVIRGEDRKIRAFLNVCRHRASRLLDGTGNCSGAIQCRYHGWSYRNDGALRGIPNPENFPSIDTAEFGLVEVRMEIYRGQIFVKLRGEGPGVTALIGALDREVALYSPEAYEPLTDPTYQIWECNWKLAWDNYQENYHIPIGHPCLHRMLVEAAGGGELGNGINWGYFEMRDKLSTVAHERRYQEGIACTDHRFPKGKGGRWLQLGMDPNMGVEYYPDLFSLFQILPLGVDKTLIKLACYSPPNMSAEESEMQQINMKLIHEVNEQDKAIVERVQSGVRTSGYQPGPLGLAESSVTRFHERVRARIPVTDMSEAPLQGTLARENERLEVEASVRRTADSAPSQT